MRKELALLCEDVALHLQAHQLPKRREVLVDVQFLPVGRDLQHRDVGAGGAFDLEWYLKLNVSYSTMQNF